MGITKADVTIVMPTRGRVSLVGKLLDAIPHRPLLLAIDPGRRDEDLPADLKGADYVELQPTGEGVPKIFDAAIDHVKTSHVFMLCDDVIIETPDWLDKAIDKLNSTYPDGNGVIAVEDGGWTGSHDFLLFPKEFYLKHCRPTPFRKYYFDTAIWEKAKRLNCASKCFEARVIHTVEGGRDLKAMDYDKKLFEREMARWVSVTPNVTRKVFIALPIYWNVDPLFAVSWIRFTQNMDFDNTIHGVMKPLIGDSAIGRARNQLTRQFLESDCTDLLFVDTDLVFSSDHVKRIVSHEEDIVGGLYCKKAQGEPQLVLNTLDTPAETKDSGLIEVKYIGTGFMRIRRSVFEKMIEAWGDDMWYAPDQEKGATEYDFWHMGVYEYPDKTRRWLSEDWWFCQKARDLGIQIFADTHILCAHSGHALYPLKDQEGKLFGKDVAAPCSADKGAGDIPASASS